ncbi:MAG: signal recognition particle protein Srp19 [Candidatus Heimdallarchaeota archaeon]|nr:signal recognition particle protein Srp19 [Candidatus Heimdallarchaeota archaeon]
MLRKKRYFVLYPEYFDKKLSKNEGRRVPKNKAVDNCNLSKIVFACKHLELEYEIEKDKKYSKNWWGSEGRIIVNPEGIESKTELIRRIANISRKLKKVEKPSVTKKGKSAAKPKK